MIVKCFDDSQPRHASPDRPTHLTRSGRLLIVTPTLGTSRYLAAAIESIDALDLDVRHVLVAPRARIAELAARWPRSEAVAEPAERGMYVAIDAALRHADDWDWFTYLNDDDVLAPGFATMAREHMAAGDTNAIAYGDVRWISAEHRNLGLMPVERDVRRFTRLMAQGIVPFTQQGTLASRAVYDRLGGFGARFQLAADFDFWRRAVDAGVRFRYAPHEVGRWRLHGDQLSMNRDRASRDHMLVAAQVKDAEAWRRRATQLWFYARNSMRYFERIARTGRLTADGVFAAQRAGA